MRSHTRPDGTAERLTLARRVALEIRDRILRGEIRWGEPLRQEELAAQLGVSRIPLREALAQLEAEGFVSIAPYIGAIVTPLTLEEVHDLCDILVALEQRALRLAIPNQTPDDCDKADAARLRLNAALDRADLDEVRDQQIALCRILNRPCGRPRMVALIDSHRMRTSRYIRVLAESARTPLTSQYSYRALIDACRRKDIEAALEVQERIYKTAIRELTEALRGSDASTLDRRVSSDRPTAYDRV